MMDLALVLNVTKLAAAQRTKVWKRLHLAQSRAEKTPPQVQVDQIRLEVHLCADTAGELAAFLGDVGSVFSPKTPVEAPFVTASHGFSCSYSFLDLLANVLLFWLRQRSILWVSSSKPLKEAETNLLILCSSVDRRSCLRSCASSWTSR